ncbi:hypothetical protein BC826DRAFT_923541 [Russula brevipes]|nr:hypothetical protein BC826DRAFT_923541 [Russula brevipes]
MEHILTQCIAPPRRIIWNLAKQTWPHREYVWPQISTGLIIGCGTISEPRKLNQEERIEPNHRRSTHKAESRLLQILITESAHPIWVLRCERVIHTRNHPTDEIQTRWRRAINERLTIDKITATKLKRDKTYTNIIKHTWEKLLQNDEGALPTNWLHNSEVLVGSRPSTMF